MRGARSVAQRSGAQRRVAQRKHAHMHHTHSTATFHSSTASSRPRTTCRYSPYLDGESGDFTDATCVVAPAALAAAKDLFAICDYHSCFECGLDLRDLGLVVAE